MVRRWKRRHQGRMSPLDAYRIARRRSGRGVDLRPLRPWIMTTLVVRGLIEAQGWKGVHMNTKPLAEARYVSITTFKRDGTPVSTHLRVLPPRHGAVRARHSPVIQPVPAVPTGPVTSHLGEPRPDHHLGGIRVDPLGERQWSDPSQRSGGSSGSGRWPRPSDERDALLAQALNRYAEGANLIPLDESLHRDRARSAHDDPLGIGEVVELPVLTSTNDDESSGGETRTLNLAVNSRLLCH